MKILKEIKFQIFYNNNYLKVDTYIKEKEGENNEDKIDEMKNIINNSLYNKSILILLKNNNNPKEYLICRLILNNPYKSLFFDNKIYKEINIELNSFRYEIIFDYYFINKSYTNLYYNNKPINIINDKNFKNI